MDYVCNFMTAEADPAAWACRREAEGWDLISVADHFFSSARPFPHVWVTADQSFDRLAPALFP